MYILFFSDRERGECCDNLLLVCGYNCNLVSQYAKKCSPFSFFLQAMAMMNTWNGQDKRNGGGRGGQSKGYGGGNPSWNSGGYSGGFGGGYGNGSSW